MLKKLLKSLKKLRITKNSALLHKVRQSKIATYINTHIYLKNKIYMSHTYHQKIIIYFFNKIELELL